MVSMMALLVVLLLPLFVKMCCVHIVIVMITRRPITKRLVFFADSDADATPNDVDDDDDNADRSDSSVDSDNYGDKEPRNDYMDEMVKLPMRRMEI